MGIALCFGISSHQNLSHVVDTIPPARFQTDENILAANLASWRYEVQGVRLFSEWAIDCVSRQLKRNQFRCRGY